MLYVASLTSRNTKMFNINLSDSEDEDLKDTEQSLPCSFTPEALFSTSQKQSDDEKCSKSTQNTLQSTQNPKFPLSPAKKTSLAFKFKKSSLSLHQQIKKQQSVSQLDNLHILRLKNPVKKPFSGQVRRIQASSNKKNLKIRQKNKIQFLNSISGQEIDEINLQNCKANRKEATKNFLSQQAAYSQIKILSQEQKIQQNLTIHLSDREGEQQIKSIKSQTTNIFFQKFDHDDDKNQNFQQEQEKESQKSGNSIDNPQLVLDVPKIQFKKVVFHDFEDSNEESISKSNTNSENDSEVDNCDDRQQCDDKQKLELLAKHFRQNIYRDVRNMLMSRLLQPIQPSRQHSFSKSSHQTNLNINLHLSSSSNENIKKLLTTPIPTKNMFQFQVHVYKDLFKTQYQLWVKYDSNRQEETVLIACGYNQSFHLDKSIFIIEQVSRLNQRQFIAQLESNFARNFYQLHGYRSYSNTSQQSNSKGPNLERNQQIEQLLNINLNIFRTVYIPNQNISNQAIHEETSPKTARNSYPSQSRNLAQIYRQCKFSKCQQNKILKLVTSKSTNFNEKFYQQNGVRKSNKTLLILDSLTKRQVLFVGKIASKKYKLMVGEGITPIQALGVLIAHVQCS